MRSLPILTISILGIGGLWLYTAVTLQNFLSHEYSPILADIYHLPQKPASTPVRLSIPKLRINAPVIPVGMDANGLMEVPKTAEEVAWYKPGTAPGENGSAVLAGHYDWTNGPAVFYSLGGLENGDMIIVTDEHGQSWQFTVDEKSSYPAQEFPVEKVFTASTMPRINLVTCDGIFNTNTQTYPNRIVISAIQTNGHSNNSDKNSSLH